DERDRVQKKTFTKWVNKHLMKVRKHINDLYEDLRDGHNLISLLEVLSGVKLPREKGRMRFHRLQNVQIALDFLKQRQVKLVNIRNDDITDGNPKLTLGLIWTIILHFQISDIYISGELGDLSAKEKLLLWTQKVTAAYTGAKCTNFSSCWSDGRLFNAIIHTYRPDLVDMERVQRQSNRENLEQAFEIAEQLGVTRLLDAEDVDVPSPDEKSVITYVSSIYDAFPKVPEGREGISATEVDKRWLEYQSHVESLISWIKQHMIAMSDKSFSQNPVELKGLYNEYIHFKETEILLKEQEKERIGELYKLFEPWIEFGRIKVPQGYHPNDVEEEWGKLIIEMLEREKLLRPAVERLELLLQIANKIQNGALSCEEKLTVTKNTLQAEAAHLESGQPVQYESDVGTYLQECQELIHQLLVNTQLLQDENYYKVEELVLRITRLQDELVTLQLECTNVYRKGHFSTPELVSSSTRSTTHFKGESLTKGLHTSFASWFRKPMTRTELVAISSSEDEGSLRFVYELLACVEEMQMKLEQAEWGNDLPSVESQLETQRRVHSSMEELGSSVKEARVYEGKISQNFRASYTETLGKLEMQYGKLMEALSFRLKHLQSLHEFVSRATAELIWLNEKEEEELAYDWSDNNPNIASKRNYFSELMTELEEKQDVFRSLQDTAELLSLEDHPAKQTVEAYSAAIQTQWQWIKQLCLCVEQHVKENAAYFQFFNDARELENYLQNLQDSIKRKYSCDHNTSLTRLEDLLQDSMDEKDQLIQSKSSVASLVGRSKTIVQLKPRNPDHAVKSTIPIKAVCDYRQIEITICRNDECVLEDNSQRTKWKVISPTGNEAMVPSMCFLIPPPNKEAIEMANRVEQLYQKVMALWHQLHMNIKSLISWNYLQKDLTLVQGFTIEKLRLVQGECQQAMKSLQAHYEDFLQDSRDSELFSVSDLLRLEEEVESSKEHVRQLLESMENEDKDETAARTYLSELKNIRLRLEECEKRLVSRIQSPSSTQADGDAIQENTLRIAEQERMQEDLQQLKSDLQHISERCYSFLNKSPMGSSTPHLRSELDLVVNKMDHMNVLSSIYLDKLKTVDVIIRNTQGAESLIKGYEVKLSQEEAVPADLTAIQSHRSTLQQWLSEVKDKNSVFSTLKEEIGKAKVVGEELYRLRQERSIDLECYWEKGSQLWDRWQRVCTQIETRHTELESIQEVLNTYRQCHSDLILWIEEITIQQELMKPGQAEDSRVLSEQLSQQTALAAQIEENQAKLDKCQKFSQQYSAAVKDYELQLMTYRAFVESQQKSYMKRRRMLSSSDAITQEFMDLRTRYTALVTLTTQHVKYISDALRRLEEEEKVVEEEKQEHVDKVKELLGWVAGLRENVQDGTAAPRRRKLEDIKKSISKQQALNEELAAKKEQVSEAIKTSQIFLAKHSHKLSHQEKEQISTQIGTLKEMYQRLCNDSNEQLQQLQSQLAQETEHKGCEAVAGVIDLGTVEIFPVFGAMQKGLIDQDTGLVLLEAQVITSDLVVPETNEKLSLEESLARNVIDLRTFQVLQELKDALHQVDEVRCEGTQLLPAVAAVEEGRISETTGLKILEVDLVTGGFKARQGRVSMETAMQEKLLTPQLYSKLLSHLECGKNLIDPNTAEKISLSELMHRCIIQQETGLRLLPVKQLAGGMVSLKSGRKVSIFRAVQEGLIDRQVTVRLLEAQLFAGGIVDPRTGHRLTVDEAMRHNLIDQDMACALLIRQLQTGGIIDTVTGERLTIDEAVSKELVGPKIALVVLESLWSFMGLLWPESGEIVPVANALEQGILSTELVYKILNKRQFIKAVFIPETTEVLSWKKAVEHDILEREVAKKLKATVIPDVMPSVQLADSASKSKESQSSRSPTGQEEQSDPLLRSDNERLMFHLMTHSYINIHDGQKLLLVDGELNNLTKALIQTQKDGSSAHMLEGSEGFEEAEESAALERESYNGTALQQLEVQFALSKGQSEKDLPPRTALENGEVVVEQGSLLLEDGESMLLVGEQEQLYTPQAAMKGESDAEFRREQIVSTIKGKNRGELLMPEHRSSEFRETKEAIAETEESKPIAADRIESTRDQKRTSETRAGVVKSESHVLMDTSESRERAEIMTESFQEVEKLKLEVGGDREIYLLNDEPIENGSVGREEMVLPKTEETEQTERHTEKVEGVLEVEERERKELLGDESVHEVSLPESTEQEEGDTLEMLLAQLQSGGITHEQTGKTLLLNEAIACGVVPSHTAVKLMEKMQMFRGFFDSHTRESLTTEEVIEEGLMNETLLQKVLASDKTISGVLDPGNNFVYSVKDAAAVGLLDKETAMRILEGQVVTGGIVDLKRGKKISVTLASNLGLIEPSSQQELVQLEKASKGKGTDEATRQKLISLQAETSGIMDPQTKQLLTVAQSVKKGLLEKETALQLLTKQIAGGGIIHHVSGMRLSVNDAMKHGLIDQDLCDELVKAESVCLHEYVHPETQEKMPLPQAVSLGLISPDFQRKVQEIQAGSGSIFYPPAGQRLTLSQAVKEGLLPEQLMEKVMSSSEIKQGIVDPESCMIVPYSEFIKKCKIDIESGQRYLEVHPFSAIQDEVSGTRLARAEAVKLGRADPVPMLRLLQAQADSGGLVEGTISKRLSLKSALEQGLLDEEMAKHIASHQMMTGGIVDAETGKRLALKEAVEKGLVSQKLAASIQDTQISKGKYGSEVHKEEKSHLLPGKLEKTSPKEDDLVLRPSTTRKPDVAEHGAGSEAMSCDMAADRDTASGRPPVTPSITKVGKPKPLPREASEDDAVHQRQGKVELTAEHPLVSGTTSLPSEPAMVKTAEKGEGRSSSYVEEVEGKELRRAEVAQETKEELRSEEKSFSDKKMVQSVEDSKETRKGFISAAGAVAPGGGEGMGSVDQAGEAAPMESVSVAGGKGERVPLMSRESSKVAICKKPAENRLAGERSVKDTEGDTLTLDKKGPVVQEKSIDIDLKPTKKQKTKKEKAKQTSIPEESTQPEKSAMEKQPPPLPNSSEKEEKSISEKIAERLIGVHPVPPEREASQEVIVDDARKGQDSSAAFKQELGTSQEHTQVETTSHASTATPAAGKKREELIIREESREAQETSVILEHAEKRPQEPLAEFSPGQAGSSLPSKSQEQTHQERSRQSSLLLPVIAEGELLETSKESTRPAKIIFSKKMCLEHDEKLISYLSMLRDIEMKIKRVQPAEQNLAALQELLHQAEALDMELKELSFPVNQELDAVKSIVANPPEEVPEQLLKALEKDAKNLQKSLSSANDVLESQLLNLRGAAESEKAKIVAHHESLQGKLQELLSWVSSTAQALDSSDYHHATDANSLNRCLQHYKELKEPLADTKSELDATAFDIQFLISEHAQDLTPQQSRQLLRLLNELQKAFRELSERVTAQVEVLQVCLQQAEQTDQVKTLQEQQAARAQSLQELHAWLSEAEDTLAEQRAAPGEGDLSALQQRQNSVKVSAWKNRAGEEEEFSDASPGSTRSLMTPSLCAPRSCRGACMPGQPPLRVLNMPNIDPSHPEPLRFQVKAAKELEENRNKIDSLLNWVSSLDQKEGILEYRPHLTEPVLGAQVGRDAQDASDNCGADSATEELDEQYKRLKAQHQELLSQQQDVILATQVAQAFLDKQGHNLMPEEQDVLRGRLTKLKDQYAASLSQSETQLKQVQVLRDELQKFLRDHGEFEMWLKQAEQDLEAMYKGNSDLASLRQLLLRQGSFSEDVISHKGDLRFITMSGQKVLDVEGAAKDGGIRPLASGSVVQSKLEDATQRYTALHSKCTKLGSHLSTLLDHYQQFQDATESLRTCLQKREAAVGELLSKTVSSDPDVLQKQLASAKQLQGDLAEHQALVEKLQKAARSLLEIQGEPTPDHGHIQETTDAIVRCFQSFSQQMAEHSDLLQKAIAQSQSVQESLESLLHSVAEIKKSLEEEQLTTLSSASIEDSLATNAKLKQDIARQKGCLEATRKMVTRFIKTTDSSTASALQGKLAKVTEHFGQLCQQQRDKEDALEGLLPKVKQYEQLLEKLQQFTENRTRMLATRNQTDHDIAHFSQHIQEINLELRQQQEDLEALEHLAAELDTCGFLTGTPQQEKVQALKKDFLQLQKVAKEREKDVSACQQQLDEFRKLVRALRKWVRKSEGKVPSTETSLGTQELQKRVQQLQALLEEWTRKGAQVKEINHRGATLENLITDIMAPKAQAKTGGLLLLPLDLREIQCQTSEVNKCYEGLGVTLRERQQQLSAILERMEDVQKEAASILNWLELKECTLSKLEAASSPAKTKTLSDKAEHNKAFLAELAQNSGKIQKVKEALSDLLEKYPDSPEAANWKKMQQELNCRWERANQATAERQQKLENSVNQLANFHTAEMQLRPWLLEKELMMSVLGPLSIDPNMLNAQKQQVQFMLKEFEARRQQHEQLNQAAQSILTGSGDVLPLMKQVQEELQGINQKWSELTKRLNSRSSQIDEAIVKSSQYQELLQGLSEKVKVAEQRLSRQSTSSAHPDALKQQLEEASEIRSDLEQLEEEVTEAQALCDTFSVLIGEQYLKDELRKRLETVVLPFKGLEDLAADWIKRLQTALASSQQFQHTFDELSTWLDDQICQQAQSQPISAKLERLQGQIQKQEELQKSLNQHSGSYEMIVAEGESLLLLVQPGKEKATLENQLFGLQVYWETFSKQVAERHSKLKDCLQKAQKFQQLMEDLVPWVEDCKAEMSQLEVTLDPVQLEATLLKSKALASDLEKHRALLEMLNSTADNLIDVSEADEDDVRDEKAGINQKMDAITEELQAKTGSIEEMSQRLKEFHESHKNIEKKLEETKQQLQICEALGPQAYSNKNLEKLRAQQEVLQALEPQVDYLKKFTQGLAEDAPGCSRCSHLLWQAEFAQQDFEAVKQRVNDCCMVLENKLEGIGLFNNWVRELFSYLADMDNGLDGMGSIGRDFDSLQSQAEEVWVFLVNLQRLKCDIEASESECKQMLENEGSPDLLALKRELETLSKRCSRLTERGKNRQEQIETMVSHMNKFYISLQEVTLMTATAEASEALQWVMGTEVETINRQLANFRV
ncbi:MACF1 factor, partial [Nothocercus nigrocapillus]|nr:MACF1 factor [Nothocercus nigrocapillus]